MIYHIETPFTPNKSFVKVTVKEGTTVSRSGVPDRAVWGTRVTFNGVWGTGEFCSGVPGTEYKLF